MLSMRIVLDPEQSGGMGEEFAKAVRDGTILHLTNEIVVSGLSGGMQSGKPSIAFGFILPDGTPVVAETSWALFRSAALAFSAKFDESNDQT